MFEDYSDDAWTEVSFSDDAMDRDVLFQIYSCHEAGDLSTSEGWRILFERYPEDPRFLLLCVFESFAREEPELVALQLERLGRETTVAAEVEALRVVVADESELGEQGVRVAYTTLTDFESSLIEEGHSRTAGGRRWYRAPEVALARTGRRLRYRPHGCYEVGDEVEHPKLGLGLVEGVQEGKIDVRFAEGTRRLIARGS